MSFETVSDYQYFAHIAILIFTFFSLFSLILVHCADANEEIESDENSIKTKKSQASKNQLTPAILEEKLQKEMEKKKENSASLPKMIIPKNAIKPKSTTSQKIKSTSSKSTLSFVMSSDVGYKTEPFTVGQGLNSSSEVIWRPPTKTNVFHNTEFILL